MAITIQMIITIQTIAVFTFGQDLVGTGATGLVLRAISTTGIAAVVMAVVTAIDMKGATAVTAVTVVAMAGDTIKFCAELPPRPFLQ